MITLKEIKKEYMNKGCITHALNGINLHVDEGELLAIVGTSGSGKSTLLNIIGGMDRASSGEYYFKNDLISSYNNKEIQRFRREYISFVFQDFELLNEYTVYENIEMPLLARNINKKERKNRINKALQILDIEKII